MNFFQKETLICDGRKGRCCFEEMPLVDGKCEFVLENISSLMENVNFNMEDVCYDWKCEVLNGKC